jgi:DNA (cytosine-5)-methyltransferase 1
MDHVDLCSGIGGFALGFEWAGLSRPVLFCDIEPWSRKVLRKHWPDVPIAEDVKELANDPNGLIPDTDPRRTILTAGYPCQPFSLAGERRGTEDDRHIWPYILSIVQRKRPSWCVFENVYGHVSMGLDEVLSNLEGQGYATRPFIVPACATDAPHRRDRVWIIGRNVADPGRKHGSERNTTTMDKNKVKRSSRSVHVKPSSARQSKANVAHTNSQRLQGQRRELGLVSKREAKHTTRRGGKEVRARKVWLPEPPVGRVADGIPRRVDRLRGLGNAIVPQIAQRIGETILHGSSQNE